jgi:hypothetical protein
MGQTVMRVITGDKDFEIEVSGEHVNVNITYHWDSTTASLDRVELDALIAGLQLAKKALP